MDSKNAVAHLFNFKMSRFAKTTKIATSKYLKGRNNEIFRYSRNFGLGFLEVIQVNKKKQNFVKSKEFDLMVKKHQL